MGDHRDGLALRVRAQPDHQEEEPLVRVGLPLLSHVVGGGLAEVEAAHGGLAHLVRHQVQAGGREETEGFRVRIRSINMCKSFSEY